MAFESDGPHRRAVVQVVGSLASGGGERVAVALANRLAERGWDSRLVATRSLGPLEGLVSPRVPVWCAGRRGRRDLRGILRLARHIRQTNVDLLHSHNHNSSYVVRVARMFARRRTAQIFHDHHGPAIGKKRMAILDRLMLGGVDACVAVSEQLRERDASLLRLPPERCLYIPNGIDVSPARDPFSGPPTVVHVANLRWPKCHAMAVEAANLLRNSFPDLKWLCVGRLPAPDDPYIVALRKRIQELRLESAFRLLGEQSDVRQILRQSHVGVLTSEKEGLPLSILEYLAEQLPVVMTDVGQAPSLLREGRCGFAVPSGDAAAMAEAIGKLLRDHDLSREYASRGRALVEKHYSIDGMLDRIIELYEAALSAKNL